MVKQLRKSYLSILIGILIVLLIVWGCLSFSYITTIQKQEVKRISGQGVTLQILYPNELLLGESASEIYFDLMIPTTYTNKVTVTLDFPPEIRPVTLTTYTNGLSAQLIFSPTQIFQSQTIAVVNAGTFNSLGDIKKQIILTTNLQTQPVAIDIKIAGIKLEAIRQLLTNAVNERNPLVLAIVAVAISAQFMFTFFAKAREEQEKFENDQRIKAEKNRDIIREHFRNRNKIGAKFAWQDLQHYNLIDYLPDRERRWLECLLNLVAQQPETDFKQIKEIQSVWGMEVAGALASIEPFPNSPDYQNLVRGLSIKELNDPILRNEIGRLLSQTTQLEDSVIPDPLPVGLDQKTKIVTQVSVSLPNSELPNPFLDHKIEKEWLLLWSGQKHLYSGTPIKNLLAKIKSNEQNNLIYGETGCGRTTLAITMCCDSSDTSFKIYFADSPEEKDLKYAMSFHLLDYIKKKPTLLLKLNHSKKKLLVAVLLQYLSPLYLEKELEKKIEELDKEQGDQNAKLRDQIAKAQLEIVQTLVPIHGVLFLPPAQIGLPSHLYNRLRDTLPKLDQFHSDEALRSFFVTKDLSAWQNQLPKASSIIQRVESTIDFLYKRFDQNNQRALTLLLKSLCEVIHPIDSLKSELKQLVVDLENLTSPTSLHVNEWVLAFAEIFDYFKLKVHLIIDASIGSASNLKQLRPTLVTWKQQGIRTTLLVETSVWNELNYDFPDFGVSELVWLDDMFQELLNHRVEQVMETPKNARELFQPPELYQAYREKSGNNPAKFIQLWNKALLQQNGFDSGICTDPGSLVGE